MRKLLFQIIILLSVATALTACQESNYPGGTVSPYLPILDLRSIYKGADVALSTDNMFGSNKITGVVISDHSGGNLPAGLLVIQDKRRLNELRGIAIAIGSEAATYFPGDSVIVSIDGGILKRQDGILQITGVPSSAVTKVASGKQIPANRVPSSYIITNPDKYESTLVAIVKGGFDPLPAPPDALSGNKILNDGFDNIALYTEPTANFATKNNLPILGNFYGIIFNTQNNEGKLIPQHRLRTANDIVYLSSTIEIAPVVISGFMADVAGGDGNYEYIQLLATRTIDFAVTPFAVVVTSNAGGSSPTGFPTQGWATGSAAAANTTARTFKFNLTTGTVAKGEFFYVGGSSKLINGSASTSIADAKWIRSFNYTTTNGDGFGLKTSGLFANSGNASGIAVFEGTTVNASTTPIDVIFIGAGGSLFTAGPPPAGYRIANTDYYDKVDPITLKSQPFYRDGSNTINLNYLPSDLGYFNKLGGIYNAELGKWIKARTQTGVLLTKTSTLQELEGVYPASTGPNDPGTLPTSLKK